jgi:hypothetical protein
LALLANASVPDSAPLLVGVKATLNVTLFPAAMVSGNAAPSRTNCELLLLSDDTVTGAPEALIVIDSVCVVPTGTLPKLTAAGLTVNWLVAIAVPVPVSDSAADELVALLAKASAPDSAPLLVGLNATLKDKLWPAAMVNGKLAPCRANCELLLLSAETVTGAPEALMLMVSVCVLPTGTLPKFTTAGLIVNWLEATAAVPVPEKGTFRRGSEKRRLPPTLPEDCGVKVTVKVTLCPPANVRGMLGALVENSLPIVWKPETDTFQVRALVSVMIFVELDPTATWPKETLAGLATIASLFTPDPSNWS